MFGVEHEITKQVIIPNLSSFQITGFGISSLHSREI